jgi:hypothetical protein
MKDEKTNKQEMPIVINCDAAQTVVEWLFFWEAI